MMVIIVIGTFAALLGIYCYAAFYYKAGIFGAVTWRVNTNKKVIAFTFDDGPNQPWTEKIARLFEPYDGHATFFVVGKNCQRFPGVVTSLQQNGHLIGAHSHSHAFYKYFSDPLYKSELAKTERILRDQKVHTAYFRFPWLYRTPWLLRSVIKHGYHRPISGQFGHILEPFQVNHKKIVAHALKISRPGSILIFHDGYNAKTADRTQTYKAVKELLHTLAAQGYTFVTVEELLANNNINSK